MSPGQKSTCMHHDNCPGLGLGQHGLLGRLNIRQRDLAIDGLLPLSKIDVFKVE